MRTFLDFEKPLAELEGKIEELRHLASGGDAQHRRRGRAISKRRSTRLLRQTFAKLTPWQKVQLARHPDRPHGGEYLDDAHRPSSRRWPATAPSPRTAPSSAGSAGSAASRVVAIAHEKGGDTEARVRHNFGMARPEGYRKAQRLMQLAERFRLPVLTFVDTAGAYPGIDAEERGQAEAIARTIEPGLALTVPFIATIIGEGGSGGAIALAAGNNVLMLENAIYSVISPEGCASILWRSAEQRAGRGRGAEAHGAGSAEARRHRRDRARAAWAARTATGDIDRRSRRGDRGGARRARARGRAGAAPHAARQIPAHGKSRPLIPYRGMKVQGGTHDAAGTRPDRPPVQPPQ